MRKLSCYAITIPGLEALASAELSELGATEISADAGGINFSATMDALFRIMLRSRICTRILIRLARFSALSFPELYNKCKKVPWERYFDTNTRAMPRATCHHSRLMHSGRAEQALADAIETRLNRTATPSGPEQQILLRIDENRCTISMDMAGERLDRRGYRMHAGRAPVRETIAAAILRWMQWQPDQPLCVPMCGSGTFAIEAAWLASARAPGLNHAFPFLHWPSLKIKRWQRAFAKAEAMQRQPEMLSICASDIDPAMLDQAKRNAVGAGMRDLIRFEQQDFFSLQPPAPSGLLICNPPYGDRIKADTPALYRSIGKHLRNSFSEWSVAIMAPDRACLQALSCNINDQIKIRHGGKWIHIARIENPATSVRMKS